MRKTANGWLALCPSHDDRQQSLSVKDAGGKVLLKCFAGCNARNIVSALGMKMEDLFDEENRLLPNKRPKRIVETYDYTDEDGKLLFQAVRFEPKGFAQRRPDGAGGFVWNLQNMPLALYRLPEVMASPVVHIVEGEKDAETLRANDLPASCNPMGAGKWRNEYSESLRGKTVIILPDNDEAGRRHAQQVAGSLYGIAKEVVVVELPNLPSKGDVTDYFENGGTIDELLDLAGCAAAFKPNVKEIETTKANATDNDLQGSKMLSNFADSIFAIGESAKDKNLRYLKQIKARNTEIIYDAENVATCQVTKPMNFLMFDFLGFGNEREHLKALSESDKTDLIAKVKNLSATGESQRKIANELGISLGAVNKYLRM